MLWLSKEEQSKDDSKRILREYANFRENQRKHWKIFKIFKYEGEK